MIPCILPIASLICLREKFITKFIYLSPLPFSLEFIMSDHNSFLTTLFLPIAHLLLFGFTQEPVRPFKDVKYRISLWWLPIARGKTSTYCPALPVPSWHDLCLIFPLLYFSHTFLWEVSWITTLISAFKSWHLVLSLPWTLSSSYLQLLIEQGFFLHCMSELHVISL